MLVENAPFSMHRVIMMPINSGGDDLSRDEQLLPAYWLGLIGQFGRGAGWSSPLVVRQVVRTHVGYRGDHILRTPGRALLHDLECNMPRKPQRKPKPEQLKFPGSKINEASLSSFSGCPIVFEVVIINQEDAGKHHGLPHLQSL